MTTTTITGKDTLTLWDRVFVDFADGDTSTITFPNEMIAVKTGKDGNTIFSQNATGKNADVVLRIIRGSADDKFLNGKLIEFEGEDIASVELASGTFVKRLGDGAGAVTSDTYALNGGAFIRKVDAKENVEGDTEVAVSIYNMRFATATRSLG